MVGRLVAGPRRCALLIACAESGLILVAFDRATLPWHAGQVIRAGERRGGLILFRRTVRTTNDGAQPRSAGNLNIRAHHERAGGTR